MSPDPRHAGAAAPAAAKKLRPRGSNHAGMRQFNERVVLQAIRLHGSLPKAEIARLTHLTPQTVQIIIARLEADDLVRKLAPVRGKVGQPSVPMALNPDGAFSIGIHVGRRRMEMLLVDFAGQIRERSVLGYPYPDPDTLFDAIESRMQTFADALRPELRPRLHGVGIAAPLSLGGWQPLLGAPAAQAARWWETDIEARLAERTPLPVQFVKDTAAACVAELVAGRGREIRSFLYFFVDTFIGGGLVLDSHLRAGVHGNAGAVGSLALGLPGPQGAPPQLLAVASLFTLEAALAAHGLAPEAIGDRRALEDACLPHTRVWLAEAAPALAMAIHGAACLLDFEGVIVDGAFGRELLGAMLAETGAALDRLSWEGVTRPALLAGTIGADARAIGGALLPLYANFAPDRDLFLKLDAAGSAPR